MSEAVTLPPATGQSDPGSRGLALKVLRGALDGFLRRREASVLLVALGVMVYFQASTPIFLTEGNLRNIAQATGPTAIVAAGMVFLLVSGEIDVSVGIVAALTPYMMHYLINFYGVLAIPAIVLALAFASLIGFVNGFISIVMKVPSFVTTLGMFYALYGFLLLTSHAYPVSIPAETKGTLQGWLGASDWASMIWCLLIVAVFHLILTRTRWGLHTIAVGGNLIGATEAGIRATRVKIGNFMIASTLGAFAGLLEAFRINSIDPNIGGGTRITFTAIAAAVIGGTALAGGSGTVIGALIGMVVLAELTNGFNLLGVNANTIFLVTGLAILVSMIANQYLSRLRRTGRTR
jgi:simple sugar transport system permease protein